MERNRVAQLPEFLDRQEADAAFGDRPAGVDTVAQLALDREMAELSDKMIVEVMALFDDAGIDLDYSEESLAELDALIGQLWGEEPIEEDEALDAVVSNWGAYLGETIRHNIGGVWTFRKDLDHVSIYYPRKALEAFPLHLVRRRLVLGPRETLAGFYERLLETLDAD